MTDIKSQKEAWIVNEFILSAVVVDSGWDRLPCTIYVRISGGELKVTIDKYCSFPFDYKKLKQGDQVVMSGYITMGNYYDNNYGDVVLIATAVSPDGKETAMELEDEIGAIRQKTNSINIQPAFKKPAEEGVSA